MTIGKEEKMNDEMFEHEAGFIKHKLSLFGGGKHSVPKSK